MLHRIATYLRWMMVCLFGAVAFEIGCASAAEPELNYITTWLGTTHQSLEGDPDDFMNVHGWTSDVAIGPNGVIYTAGGAETHGKKAFRYNEAEDRVEVVAKYNARRTGGPSSSAAVVDDRYFYYDDTRHGVVRAPLASGDEWQEFTVDRKWPDAFEEPGEPLFDIDGDISVRWTGTITIPESGEYQIGVLHHDGARLWLGGEQVVDHWRTIFRTHRFGPKKHYEAGDTIDVRLEYFKGGGNLNVRLQWQRPDGVMVAIPTDVLSTPDGERGLKGEYFSDKELKEHAFTRVDRYIDNQKGRSTSYSGLALRDELLYAADASRGRIRVFNTKTLKQVKEWPLDFRPGRIAIDRGPDGPNLWVAQPSAGKVHSYTLDGKKRAQTIEGVAHPTALGVDGRNRLYVGDSGPDNWFLIYDVAGAPKQVSTFGEKGGVWSEPSGRMGPLRFRNPLGIDFDKEGRIYVALGFALRGQGSTHIECYEPDGTRLWQVYTHMFVGNAVPDPSDETVLHTARARWRADWSKPMGEEFTIEALTWQEGQLVDRADSRYSAFFMPYRSTMIDGQKFYYMTAQKGGNSAWVYREDSGQLIPAAYLTAATSGSFKYTPGGNMSPYANPLGRGTWGAMIWCDLDGDGQFVHADNTYPKEEFSVFIKGYASSTATVDDAGAFWFIRGKHADRRNDDPENRGRRVLGRIRVQGLTPRGVPIYEAPYEDYTDRLPEFHDIAGMEYDANGSVMYFMAREEEGKLHLFRHDDFPDNPQRVWKSPELPWNDTDFTPNTGYGAGQPTIPKAAGDYVFVTYGYGGWTRIYDARDGSYVGTLKPNTITSNRQGEVDSHHSTVAHRLSSGDYAIFVQSSGKHRVTVYRWKP